MCELFGRAWRQSSPAAITTRINRRCRRLVTLRTIKVNSELLPSDDDVAIFNAHVRPCFGVVRIVVIRILRKYTRRGRYDDDESNAQQNPTMNEAACFHVFIISGKPLRPSSISSRSALRT